MPTATDLVTDLPADFEVFGQAVATSMADLLGGTSGQILAKNSNTDMDFVWIANDQGDITGITATSPLTGGGTSGAVTVGIQDALTTQKGAVQLSDSTSTTSSILAATPTAVKTAYDLANAAIAKTTVTTAGDIIYRNATVPTRLAIGTASQVLTVNSGATAPEWTTLATGGFTKIATASLSAATSISFTSIPTTYKRLQIIFSNIYQSAQDVFWGMRLNNNSTAGAYFFRGAYTGSVNGGTYGGTSATYFGSDFYDAPIGTTRYDDFPAQKGYAVIDIFNADSASVTKQVQWQFNGFRPGQAQTITNFGNGYYDSTTAISRVDFIRSSTQSITGTIELWGSN